MTLKHKHTLEARRLLAITDTFPFSASAPLFAHNACLEKGLQFAVRMLALLGLEATSIGTQLICKCASAFGRLSHLMFTFLAKGLCNMWQACT